MTVEVEPIDEIRGYLLEENYGILAKLQLDEWYRVAPMFERLVDPGMPEDVGSQPSARRSLVEQIERWMGDPLPLSYLDGSRPAYFVFAPYRHAPSQGCLSAGLPCALLDEPGPRYGRVFLPTERPSEFAADLQKTLGRGVYRVVEHNYWVRVEFAMQWADLDQVQEHLDVRALDDPDISDRRATPARRAFLDRDAPFAVYFGIRDAVDAAMYGEEWRLQNQLADSTSLDDEQRMRFVLRRTAEIGRLVRYYMPRQSEVEDVAIFVDGEGSGGQNLQFVSSRTRVGQQIADVAAQDVQLPDLSVDGTALSLEWSVRFDRVVRQAGRADWIASPGVPLSRFVGDKVGWSWLGWVAAPSAAAATMVEQMRAAGGPDLSKIVAGRLQLEGFAAGDSSSLASVRGGGVLLLAPGDESQSLVQWAEATARLVSAVDAEIVRRADGFTEVRFGLHMPVRRVVSQDAATTSVERLQMLASPDFVAELTRRWAPGGGDSTESWTVGERLVRGLVAGQSMRVRQYGERDWTSLQIAAGTELPDRAAPEPQTFASRQLRAECMDAIALKSADLIERVLEAEDTDVRLDDILSVQVGTFRGELADCGAIGQREQELAQWAIDYLDGWRSLVSYRTDGELWKTKMRQLCEGGAGYEWACEPGRGTWPWLSPAR